jgi:LPXTG-motif cell wall-anchored protein
VAAASVAASSVAAPSGELPVTGAQVLWLILGGIMLLGVGATLRTRLN